MIARKPEKQPGDKMSRADHYNKVKELTREAVDCINWDLDGNYKGYTGANAVSLCLNDENDINVTCDNEAGRAFKDVLSGQ